MVSYEMFISCCLFSGSASSKSLRCLKPGRTIVREYQLARLLVNLSLCFSFWLTLDELKNSHDNGIKIRTDNSSLACSF
jgi:hypothetical protein